MTRIKSNQRRDAYHLGKASLPVIIFIKALSWWNLKVTVTTAIDSGRIDCLWTSLDGIF